MRFPVRTKMEPFPAHRVGPYQTVERVFRFIGLFAMLALTEALYVLIVSAGKSGEWPSYMAYYDLLADGFRAGHLHLSLEPAPELLARSNPFDVRYADQWLGDASLHNGHYYLYWGPLPALILAIVKSLFGIHRTVAEQYLVFWGFTVWAAAEVWFLDALRARLVPRLPYPLFALSVLACTLGSPVPALLGSATVYQVAIAGGQAFLMVGLALAFSAVTSASGGRPARWKLSLAGASWIGAVACRLSLAPAAVLLVLVTAALAEEGSGNQGGDGRSWWRRAARNGAWLTWPVALGGAGLLLYNYLRFGSWLESGVNLQLTTWPFRFSPRYALPNIHQYLMRLPDVSCRFPFLHAPYETLTPAVIPPWMPFREGYVAIEPVAGMAWAFPLVWMMPVAVVFAWQMAIRRRLKGPAVTAALPTDGTWDRAFLWCVSALGIAATVTFLAPLGMYLATLRYMGDLRSGVGLLGTFGLWMLHARSARVWQRHVVTGLIVVINVSVVVVGLLLGYSGYGRHFDLFNPTLAAKLQATLSLCK